MHRSRFHLTITYILDHLTMADRLQILNFARTREVNLS